MADLMAAVLKLIKTDRTTPSRYGRVVRCYLLTCWKPATVTAINRNGRIGRYCETHNGWANYSYAVATHLPIEAAAKAAVR